MAAGNTPILSFCTTLNMKNDELIGSTTKDILRLWKCFFSSLPLSLSHSLNEVNRLTNKTQSILFGISISQCPIITTWTLSTRNEQNVRLKGINNKALQAITMTYTNTHTYEMYLATLVLQSINCLPFICNARNYYSMLIGMRMLNVERASICILYARLDEREHNTRHGHTNAPSTPDMRNSTRVAGGQLSIASAPASQTTTAPQQQQQYHTIERASTSSDTNKTNWPIVVNRELKKKQQQNIIITKQIILASIFGLMELITKSPLPLANWPCAFCASVMKVAHLLVKHEINQTNTQTQNNKKRQKLYWLLETVNIYI